MLHSSFLLLLLRRSPPLITIITTTTSSSSSSSKKKESKRRRSACCVFNNEERPPPLISTSTILSPLARVSAVNNIIFDDIATPSAETLLEIEHLLYILRRNVLTNHSPEDQEKHYQGNNEIYCSVLASAIMYKTFFIGS